MAYLTRSEALKNPARALLHGLVQSVPGISLTTLARRVGLETSSVNWHLRKLADAGLLVGERHGPSRIFFTSDTPAHAREQARAAHSLATGAARDVLDAVVRSGPVVARDVSGVLGISVAQARHQLHRLRQHGLLERIDRPTGHLHFPSPLAAGALELARVYEEALEPDAEVDRLLDGPDAVEGPDLESVA